MSPIPTVAVVVISHNTRDLLLECLESIARSTQSMSVEITVVDNASRDGSYEAVRETFPSAVAIRNTENAGFGRACNQAIRSTQAPFVLLLNSDSLLNEPALQVLWRHMESDSACGAAGCVTLSPTGERLNNTWNFLTPFNQVIELLGLFEQRASRRFRRTYKPKAQEADCNVDWIDGSCLLLRRAALEETGLFDERFFMYSEDEDLCYRLRQQGWTVCYLANARLTHHGGASAAQYGTRMIEEFYRSQMMFLEKHHGRGAVRVYAVATWLALWLKRLLIKSGERPGPTASDRLEALRKARKRI